MWKWSENSILSDLISRLHEKCIHITYKLCYSYIITWFCNILITFCIFVLSDLFCKAFASKETKCWLKHSCDASTLKDSGLDIYIKKSKCTILLINISSWKHSWWLSLEIHSMKKRTEKKKFSHLCYRIDMCPKQKLKRPYSFLTTHDCGGDNTIVVHFTFWLNFRNMVISP